MEGRDIKGEAGPDNRPYYEPGTFYLVADENGLVLPQKLVGFRGPCCNNCAYQSKCPGLLLFESGQTLCPTPPPGMIAKRLKHAPLTPAWRAMQMFAKLLVEKGKKRGAVELADGRTIRFTVDQPKDTDGSGDNPGHPK